MMKPHPDNSSESPHDREQADPVWQLLGNASKREPSNSFARNIVRQARLLPTAPSGRFHQMRSLFTGPRLVTAACACALLVAAFQLWPSAQSLDPVASDKIYPVTETSSALSELIIEESLNAAAEDPSIYTRDEIVAMIGL
ncbi:MAG: hypothetical protein ACPIB0_04885 [Akkermansiaceae bacterium]